MPALRIRPHPQHHGCNCGTTALVLALALTLLSLSSSVVVLANHADYENFWIFYATPIGSGQPGHADSRDPSQVRFDQPIGVAVHEPTHDVYVAEWAGRIRKISNATGEVSTVLTLDQEGISDLTFLNTTTATTSQTLVFSHTSQHCLKSIDLDSPNATVQEFAGKCGIAGFITATRLTSEFNQPSSIAVTPSSDSTLLWVVDSGNKAITYVNMTSDEVFFITNGNFDPIGLVWARQGAMVLAINRTCIVLIDIEMDLSQIFEGSCTEAGTADGYDDEARFNRPRRLAIDANSEALFVTDDNIVRVIVTETLPSSGGYINRVRSLEYRNEGGPPAYNATYGVGAISGKKIFVADRYGSRVWRLDLCPFRYWRDMDGDGFGDVSTGVCVNSTLAPDGFVSNYLDCNDSSASVHPNGTEDCSDGIDNNCDGIVDEGTRTGTERPIPLYTTTRTYAGSGSYNATDGPLLDAEILFPISLAHDPRRDLLYVGTAQSGMRVIDPVEGTVKTVINVEQWDEKPGITAGLAVDGDIMYVADAQYNCVLMLNVTDPGASQPWLNTSIALCNPNGWGSVDGPYSQARLSSPCGVLVDPTEPGHLFIADTGNNCIRRASHETAMVETYAGTCESNGITNGDRLTQSRFSSPYAMAYHEHSASFLISDSFNNCIRSINASGYVSTVAGACDPYGGSFFEGPSVNTARFKKPRGIAVDPENGMVYIMDSLNYRIRRIDLLEGIVTTVAGTGADYPIQDGPNATFCFLLGVMLAPHSNGSLLVTDLDKVRIIECASAEYYVDEDDDGYPNATNVVSSCYHRANYFPVATANPCLTFDCDDSDASAYVEMLAYHDADGDEYVAGYSSICTSPITPPPGYRFDDPHQGSIDCDDSSSLVHPSQADFCNGVDDDCDTQTDEDAPALLFYLDADGDRYGNPQYNITACRAPEGYVPSTNPVDCDDNNPAVTSGCSVHESESHHTDAAAVSSSIVAAVLVSVLVIFAIIVLLALVAIIGFAICMVTRGNKKQQTSPSNTSSSATTTASNTNNSTGTATGTGTGNGNGTSSNPSTTLITTSSVSVSVAPGLEVSYEEIKNAVKIGAGSFGQVFKAELRGETIAVKQLKNTTGIDDKSLSILVAEFSKEVNLMASLKHPNVIALKGVVTSFPRLCIITEYMDSGTLFDKLYSKDTKNIRNQRATRRISSAHEVALRQNVILSWHHKLKLLLDAARGIQFLHQNRVIHRDLKSANILLCRDKSALASATAQQHPMLHCVLIAKIADLGLSKIKSNSTASQHLSAMNTQGQGTMLWMAPEVTSGEMYGTSADVFSFAIIMSEVLSERMPYSDDRRKETVHIRVAMEPTLRPAIAPIASDLQAHRKSHEEFIDLMKQCWEQDPNNRPGMDFVIEKLTHIQRMAKQECDRK